MKNEEILKDIKLLKDLIVKLDKKLNHSIWLQEKKRKTNRIKHEEKYRHVINFIELNIEEWVSKGIIPTREIKDHLSESFTDKEKPGAKRWNMILKDYCRYNGIIVENNVQRRVNGIKVKCYDFKTIN